MRRKLILTPKFKRAFRKFVRRNAKLQKHIENTLLQMQEDIFAASLGTHKLSGILEGLRACSCGYDCRIVFSLEPETDAEGEVIVLLQLYTDLPCISKFIALWFQGRLGQGAPKQWRNILCLPFVRNT